jgi:hypothetical protein
MVAIRVTPERKGQSFESQQYADIATIIPLPAAPMSATRRAMCQRISPKLNFASIT